MSNEQTRDILAHAQQFHRNVSQYYQQLSNQTAKERIRMLLDYMSAHEQRLASSLAKFEDSAPKQVLNACFKVGRDFKKCCEIVPDVPFTADISVDDVLDMGLRFDDCLIDIYQDLAEKADDEGVRNVFQNLLEMEQKEKRQLVRNAQRVMDF